MRVKASLITLTTFIFLNLVYSQQAIKGISTSSSDLTLLKYYGETLDTIATCKTSTDGAFNFNNLLSTGYYRLCQDSVKVDFIHSENKGTWIQISNNHVVVKSEENEILDVLKNRYLADKKRIGDLRTLSLQSNDSAYIERLNEQIENLHVKKYIFFDSLENERPNSFALATTLSYIKAIEKSTEADYFKYMPINSAYLNSSLYPQLIMLYLKQHTNYDEDGFKHSIDRILNHTQADEAVYEYALEFLLSLFDKVGPQIMYDYIVDNYILNSSCGIEASSLSNERIQSYLNLRIGNKPENIVVNGEDLYAICKRKPRTLIIFWSSFCGHCEAKLPQVKSMLDSLHSDSYQVLSISLDTDLKSFNEISKQFPWMHVCDQLSWDSPIVRHFKVNKTPTIYTLSSEGTIISKSDKLAEIKEAIESK